MKFALIDSYRYWWPVTILPPDPDNAGKVLKQTMKIEFEAENRDEAIARMEKVATLPPSEQDAHELDELRRIVKNWDEVTEADLKTPVPFTPEVFEKALKNVWFRIGVYRAYGESLAADKARLGN
ncbi:hypothetical protein [Pararhizobium gei]|uniref:hypothetical protein n=1 Tax=Pararhizobium gei TaxID=1395951 RepID=UPI0023DBC7FD|nr:hypothetical protein [Rhizobium gei]